MAVVRLKPGHVQPIWAGHPWIYAQAIDRIEGGPLRGDEVDVVDPRGNFLGRGFYSPGSAIPVRILARDPDVRLELDFFRGRIREAMALRAAIGLPSSGTNGYRLIHAEGDRLPGLIVDRFDDTLVLQLLTFGMKAREATVLQALAAELRPKTILDRTPATAAKAEGFTASSGVVYGESRMFVEFTERELAYRLPLDLGQKTGFYFDQRALRARVEQIARGRRVLDTYSYVGAFSLAAARGGARSVTAVDDSALAIEIGAEVARANGFADKIVFIKADARRALQDAASEKDRYDLVLVDPPRLAPNRGARENALVAYAKLAESACRAVADSGFVLLSSCSGAVDLTALTRALAMGALRANVQATVIERGFQGADHPVPSAFPEGLYLKALLARVTRR